MSDALEAIASSLYPLLCDALAHDATADADADADADDAADADADADASPSNSTERAEGGCDAIRLAESGLLISTPGATAQPLHTDTDGAYRSKEAVALKMQVRHCPSYL